MIRLVLTFTSMLFAYLLIAQNINPEYGKIFVQNEVSRIDIKMNENEKQELVYPEDASNNTYYKVEFRFQNSLLDTTLNEVGIRIRGNTSRNNIKKSFKIDFKEFGGEKLKKLKKLNLKPNTNDPSMVREPLSWLLYQTMNVPAARTAYVNLYINDEYMGVYQNVENIDDEFVDRRYGSEEGNLYKCYWGATLASDNDLYNDNLYSLKTNEDLNDRSHLQALVDHLNAPITDGWVNALEAQFDVSEYLMQLAVESMIGHWDGYSYNSNNFYLYYDTQSNKIHFIPYDLDNTWGIDWIGPDWGKQDLNNWYSNWLNVVLTKKILAVQEYKNQYINNISKVLTHWKDYKTYAKNFQETVVNEVADDYFYTLDRGYEDNDFKAALEQAAGEHVEYGIYDYIDERYENALDQIGTVNTSFEINTKQAFAVYPNPTVGNYIHVKSIADIEIYDALGNSIPFERDDEIINFNSKLKNGIYIVKSQNELVRFVVFN